MKSIAAVLAIALFPHAMVAQNPGQKITVSVQPTSVVARGDTIGITSVVTNLGSSQESLVRYSVDAPAGVVLIHTPNPEPDWLTFPDFRSRPMAFWGILSLLPPGSSTPPLYFESVGLPGILTYWAGGKYQLPMGDDLPESTPIPDPLVTAMITGKTVGVEPFPPDRTPQGLLARLRTLTQTACSAPLIWITNSTLCNQLVSDLDQAESYRSNGQGALAKDALAHYQGLLVDGNAGGSVTSSGYWLLRANAEIINRTL
jgi:hypothetical protein